MEWLTAWGYRMLGTDDLRVPRFLYLQLIVRLMGDSRVNLLIKLLPVSVLIYWVVPFDFLPMNSLDDALAIWLG